MLLTAFISSAVLAGASSKPTSDTSKPKSPYEMPQTTPKKSKPKTFALSAGDLSTSEKDSLKDMKKPIAAVPHQFLIAFQKDMSDEQCRNFLEEKSVKVLEKVGSTPLYLIEVKEDSKEALETSLQKLRDEKEVRYVEANALMQTFD